jgi:hypothetical protein
VGCVVDVVLVVVDVATRLVVVAGDPPSQPQVALQRPVVSQTAPGGSQLSPGDSRPSPHQASQSVPPWRQHVLQVRRSVRHRDPQSRPAARAAFLHILRSAPRPVHDAWAASRIAVAWTLQRLTACLHSRRQDEPAARNSGRGAPDAGRACGARSSKAPSATAAPRIEHRHLDGDAASRAPPADTMRDYRVRDRRVKDEIVSAAATALRAAFS